MAFSFRIDRDVIISTEISVVESHRGDNNLSPTSVINDITENSSDRGSEELEKAVKEVIAELDFAPKVATTGKSCSTWPSLGGYWWLGLGIVVGGMAVVGVASFRRRR